MPIRIYNREFATNSMLEVEYLCFREGWGPDTGALGRTQHFIRIVKETWPWFVWHEDAEEQAAALCENDITGFTAGANYSKSDMIGKFCLVTWWSDPIGTLVIVCSTTAMDAKAKLWGHIVRDFRSASAQGKAVGKLIESLNIIRLTEKSDGIAASDNSSITLVAAGNEATEDSLRRLQGRKAVRHVVLALDELQDCSQTIIDQAYWNLSANPRLSIHASGNAASRFDPHGTFMKPVDGWNKNNRTTHRWKIRVGTKEGVALHFDATRDDAPNMSRFYKGLPQHPFMRKAEEILAAKNILGESNPMWMRQFVGYWSDVENESDFLMTEQDITTHQADVREHYWQSSPTDFAGIDPSYSRGGDRFIFAHLQWGISTHGIWTLFCKESITLQVIPRSGETKDDAAVRLCRDLAEKRKILPRNVGTDDSAATSFTSILHKNWSPEILPVPFGGAPTDLPVSFHDKRIASESFMDRSTELLAVWKEFVIHGQVRGMSTQHVKECTSRKYKLVGNKIRLESKKEQKERLGYSPDEMDGYDIALAVARDRLKIQAGGIESGTVDVQQQHDMKAFKKKHDIVGRTIQARRRAIARY